MWYLWETYEEDGYLSLTNKVIFEGKEYFWNYCSIECVYKYDSSNDEILKKINEIRRNKLQNFLKGQKIRLDHPKFKI